ncbi:hypothetical protein OBBRIDRAFT_742717 [Obba rivulosa]|uniref:Uncharacterized protein n=1 Tax=Obba rivulosa TaxID=1052685 RepID=A0A8E2AG65_9APHY|nr:hypothetical protein OBBRIDRAFT_742717 [Obba rivulosa]
MPIRWNTKLAEIERGLILRPAIQQWVEQLDRGLTGQKKAAATRKKKKWYLGPSDWELLEELTKILAIFRDVTLDLSRKGVPTICMTLPLYKHMEQHMRTCRYNLRGTHTAMLRRALSAGLAKLDVYMAKALASKYTILGAVLHPAIWLKYFENHDLWSEDVPDRARAELKELYKEYSSHTSGTDHAAAPSKVKRTGSTSSIFASAISSKSAPVALGTSGKLERYFGGQFPCDSDDDDGDDTDRCLKWWKVC